MTIIIDRLIMGYLDNNVYIVSDGEGTFVVDPSTRAGDITAALAGRELDAILCTHFHSDHTGALAELHEMTGATVYASEPDSHYIEQPKKVGTSPIPLQAPCAVDKKLQDGDVVTIGEMAWQSILTPGHSLGGMCWYLPAGPDIVLEGRALGPVALLFSGDTLFAGTTGRTDFLGGSMSDMQASLIRLSLLPDDTIVLPGHNDFTTIGAERVSTFRRWAVC